MGALGQRRRLQALSPVVEQRQAIGRRAVALVGEVVGRTGECVDGGDVRAHRGREQERRDGKILVVLAGGAFARGVRVGQGHHSASATPARRFTTRASTKSRSDRRFM